MKRGCRGWGKAGLLTVLAFLFTACGNSSSVSSSLSSGGGGGTGITNTFSSPAEMGVGDIMPIEFADVSDVTVDFSGVASGANFILAMGSSDTSGSGGSIQLTADIALPGEAGLSKATEAGAGGEGEAEDAGYGAQEIMSAWLRASESVLSETETPAGAGGSSLSFSKAMSFKAASVGDTETFRVLGSLSSSSYVEVPGQVRCVGANVIFYVDAGVGSDLLSDEDVQTLCSEFDEVAGEEQDLLGEISDVDGNGKLKVLMTKQINCLGAMGGGIITGYFYAVDLFNRSDQNALSNEAEIIFTMVPDPDRAITCSGSASRGPQVSREFAMSNLLPAVLPHELQHAISYNQHVFVNNGVAEEDWLNEGMSHLAEDLMGYNVENPSRYAMYLASPSTYGVVTQNSPNLMERGAAYLFLRFLYEQASDGTAFLKALENSPLRGVDNLEAAFNGAAGFGQFSELMARWVVAMAMTDRGISQDSRYVYRARTRHPGTNNWQGVCLDCDADDNRGTVLTGVNLNQYYGYHNPTIDAATAMYYNITTLPDQMRIVGAQGGGSFGILIRTQ